MDWLIWYSILGGITAIIFTLDMKVFRRQKKDESLSEQTSLLINSGLPVNSNQLLAILILFSFLVFPIVWIKYIYLLGKWMKGGK